jgi:F-type H+-transporting ATPase subunit alpha
MRDVPVNKIKEFEKDYLSFLNAKYRDVLDQLKAGKLTDEITDALKSAAKEISSKYKA